MHTARVRNRVGVTVGLGFFDSRTISELSPVWSVVEISQA